MIKHLTYTCTLAITLSLHGMEEIITNKSILEQGSIQSEQRMNNTDFSLLNFICCNIFRTNTRSSRETQYILTEEADQPPINEEQENITQEKYQNHETLASLSSESIKELVKALNKLNIENQNCYTSVIENESWQAFKKTGSDNHTQDPCYSENTANHQQISNHKITEILYANQLRKITRPYA